MDPCVFIIGALAFVMLSSLWSAVGSRKRRRGGHRQRALQEEAEEESASASRPSISRLAAGHLRDYADGVQSASKMIDHMHNAVLDGMDHPMVQKLGNLQGGQNAQRSMNNLMEDLGLFNLQTVVPEAQEVTRTMRQTV